MEEQPVLISITTLFSEESGEAPVEEIVRGTMMPLGKGIVLNYRIFSDDDPAEMRTVRVTACGSWAMIAQTGDYVTNMVYETGKHYETAYVTPYGELPVAICTTRYRFETREREGSITMDYTFAVGGADQGKRRTRITYSLVDVDDAC